MHHLGASLPCPGPCQRAIPAGGLCCPDCFTLLAPRPRRARAHIPHCVPCPARHGGPVRGDVAAGQTPTRLPIGQLAIGWRDGAGHLRRKPMTSVLPAPRTTADPTAWDLVAATQRGDRDAFGKLYERYVHVVFRYVLARTGDRTLTEDLTSETFFRALRRIGSVSDRGQDIGAWFVTIARNLILDMVKSSRYKLEITTGDIPDAGTEPSVDGSLITQEVGEVILASVELLNDVQRECVVLRHFHGLSVAETAAALGCSEGAVKARTHRGIRTLAEMDQVRALV